MINEPRTSIKLEDTAQHELGRGIADIIDTIEAHKVLKPQNYSLFVKLAEKTLSKQGVDDPKSVGILSTDIKNHFEKIIKK